MLEFVFIVLLVVFYISISNRMKSLENKVNGAMMADKNIPPMSVLQPSVPSPQNMAEQSAMPVPPIATIQSQPISENINQNVVMPSEKSSVDKFFSWLADEWPLKVGIFLLILAVGWFVTYAFINDWIGEVGRITLGVVFGMALLSWGFLRTGKHQLQGNALLVLGSASILISIISGIGLYHLFPATVALIVAFMLVVFMTYVSLQQKNASLGIVTLLMGSIVPMFVFSSIDISIIFLYLFILTAGTLWVTSKTGWNALNIMALLAVLFYSVAYDTFEGFTDDIQNLVFAFAFIALFFFSNIATILFKRLANAYDLAVAGGTGMLFLIWMMMIAPGGMKVYLIVFGALLFALGSYAIFAITKLKTPVTLYAAVALMLLVSATAIQFDSWELTVAYAVEFSLFIMISLYLKSKDESGSSLGNAFGAVLYVILLLMSLVNIEEIFRYLDQKSDGPSGYYYGREVALASITSDLVVIALLCVMSFAITALIMQLFTRENRIENNYLTLARFYGILGGFYAVVSAWVMAHLILDDQTAATIISLVIYTLMGVLFYAMGKKNGHGFYKLVGGSLFAIVLFRLFFFEFAEMDMVGKIITFFVVGVLFVSTTFIGGRNKNKTIENI